ncbi:MAG: helix-turn-helix transcriptional regulator [Paludibacter sp.]|nr:helix-turn-helix transcriptional regulator [Paludibacter sp.]
MKKHKLIEARKSQNKTQKDMADLLSMSQSQYQRRESGEIHIFEDQWFRIAKFLEKDVEDIHEEDTDCTINQYFDNVAGNYIGSNNNYCNVPEFLLENQYEYIKFLKQKIADLEEKLNQKKI